MNLFVLIKAIFVKRQCSKNNHLWKITTPTLSRRALSSRKNCLCGHYNSYQGLLQDKSEQIMNAIKKGTYEKL